MGKSGGADLWMLEHRDVRFISYHDV